MVKKIRITDYAMLVLIIIIIALIIYLPRVSAEGARAGLKIAANLIIPSLFPFAVPVLYLMNSRVFSKSKRPTLILYLLSLIGGYPIGAKLLYESNSSGKISVPSAKKYLPFCVNAGPAFIVIVVGKGVLNSTKLGYLLLATHLLSSLIITALFAPEIFKKDKRVPDAKIAYKYSFAESVKNASGTTLNICAFVVVFSVINAYINYFANVIKPFKYLSFITEITSALTYTNNIYLIAFLLGFAGISIWIQVYSIAGKAKPRFLKFIIARLLHGTLSAIITILLVRIFKLSFAAISNSKLFSGRVFYDNFSLSLSLVIMVLLFLINLTSKKHSGNFLKSVL